MYEDQMEKLGTLVLVFLFHEFSSATLNA